MINIFIFRRIELKDENIEFKTGKDYFDRINPSGTLKEYIDEDKIKGGDNETYIFFGKKENIIEILGILRYRYINLEYFKRDLLSEKISQQVIEKILNEIEVNKSKIVYLSRIGIKSNYQRLSIGSIISSFFEFLIKRKQSNCLVYSKVLKQAKNLFRTTDTIKLSFSKKWNEFYYLILKNYHFL